MFKSKDNMVFLVLKMIIWNKMTPVCEGIFFKSDHLEWS